MLQRAASNAYSWWWASHIRTKQSKWLEQNLQDMGEKVQIMLKLIEEDGDSFAKRAEMYYKKRPELIQFVEESYRAYRALAERYDHLSNELQNANRTLATVFPEQVQFSMDEEDEYANSRLPKKPSTAFIPKDIPKAPKELVKDPKAVISSASKRLQTKKATNSSSTNGTPKSGLSKPQALEEINKLQKEILGLQTEKEFVKSSYENGLIKYWEIEEQIMEKHERICKLQDEFGAGPMIEDDVARSLMAEAAIKSCHETLAQLQEKQGKTAQDAKMESKRVVDFWEKLSSLKNEIPHSHSEINQEKPVNEDENVKARDNLRNLEEEKSCATQVRKDLELLREKVSEQFESGSNASLSVTEMAEKVDEIVDKVMNLESAVSSHAALVKRLRAENDDLQTQIRNLEDDKESLISDAGEKSKKLKEMEEKFDKVQELNNNIENKNNSLQINFTEAQCSLEHLSEKLHDVKPDEEVEITGSSQKEERSSAKIKIKEKSAKKEEHIVDSAFSKLDSQNAEKGPGIVVVSQEVELNSEEKPKVQDNAVILESAGPDLQNGSPDTKLMQVNSFAKEEGSIVEVILKEESQKPEMSDHVNGSGEEKDILAASSTYQGEKGSRSVAKDDHENLFKCQKQKVQDKPDEKVPLRTSDIILDTEAKKEATVKEDEPDWQNLLNEYTTVLRNYKDVKKKLDEVKKKDKDNLIDKQVRELRSANALKDEEIRSLHQKLSLMQRLLDENKDVKGESTSAGQQQTNALDVNLYTLLTSSPASMSGGVDDSNDIKLTPVYQPQSISPVEEKFRMSIDELLEQNLDFWLRFSTSFGEVQKFESEVRDLQAELSKMDERVKKQEGSNSPRYNMKSDARPIYKHLREIHTELTLWVEKSVLLKEELKSRFSSLCDIQEEITKALKESAEDDDFTFTSYQAAKFQGEILNMKQENNKVADELQAGLDHVTTLKLEVEQTLAKLNEEFKLLSGSKKDSNLQFTHSENRTRVPLRSFIFGVKQKKQKPSLFACVSPVLHKKYNMRPGSSGPPL